MHIPILRPKLPPAEALRPYLDQIDRARWYSNFGPLEQAFVERLADHFGIRREQIACTSNATMGLYLALAAQGPARGSLCAMPAWTFAAVPGAARLAGLDPYFLDVEAATWALEAGRVGAARAAAPRDVGAAIAVAPFGAACDPEPWARLARDWGLAVVIDAAASFDCAQVGDVPVVISLHATKAFGIGEGGLLMCRDAELIARVKAMSQFGFRGGRNAAISGINAKLSEYHAAVGHAVLDGWNETRAEFIARAKAYIEKLSGLPDVRPGPSFDGKTATSTCNVTLSAPYADEVIGRLGAEGIEARQWWDKGCHAKPAFADCPRGELPVTDRFAATMVSLPFYRDLPFAHIERVVDALGRAVEAR